MDATQTDMNDEAAIRELVEQWADAVRRRDFDGILRSHSSDMLMFDVPPPLRLDGIDAYRKSWDLFYAWSPEPAPFDIREMHITAGSDVAFAVALMRCSVRENGDYADLDFRLTVGLCKIEGQWIITHEHHSIPATQ